MPIINNNAFYSHGTLYWEAQFFSLDLFLLEPPKAAACVLCVVLL